MRTYGVFWCSESVKSLSGDHPKRDSMPEEDFMTNYQWDMAVQLIQADNPFAGLSYGSLAWTNKVQCYVYFFPSNWDCSDLNPTQVSFPLVIPLIDALDINSV